MANGSNTVEYTVYYVFHWPLAIKIVQEMSKVKIFFTVNAAKWSFFLHEFKPWSVGGGDSLYIAIWVGTTQKTPYFGHFLAVQEETVQLPATLVYSRSKHASTCKCDLSAGNRESAWKFSLFSRQLWIKLHLWQFSKKPCIYLQVWSVLQGTINLPASLVCWAGNHESIFIFCSSALIWN